MNVLDFYQKKKNAEKITMVTCYDYTSARILTETAIDCLLVGDTLAMIMHGYQDTLSATLELMCLHTQAVSRGAPNKFIVCDMPFLSYRKSFSKSITAAQKLMQSGANALKLECATGNLKFIRHLTESGVPVMGHLGLTPQHKHILGGYKVQGKNSDSAKHIKEDAISLQDAGCFSLVLECIPAQLAQEISERLQIPTIGIGAGPYTDGQVLVYQDLLGMNSDFIPKFVKSFANGKATIMQGIENYIAAVHSGVFPKSEHSYES